MANPRPSTQAMTTRDDASWIERALERHETALVAYAARITGDVEAARDVVQETYLKLCRARREAVEPQLAEWLFTVCRNAAVDLRRKRGRAAEDEEFEMAEIEGSTGFAAAAEAERRDEGARAITLLASLPGKQREVLRLRFESGLSYKEIARVTGQSIGNVGWLIHMGLKSLRAQLAGDAVEGMV
jgi:RNA polymerase sigma factor (sigma-70 family)